MTAFYNFLDIIKDIGIDYREIFAKFRYNFVSNLMFRNNLRFYEKYMLLCAYFRYLFNDNYGKTTKLYDYLIFYKFSTASINIIDNICVYIDEGNIKTYSLNKFIKLYDVLFNSKILVASKPLDYFLFNIWKKYLENRGVEFLLSNTIKDINIIDNSVSCVELLNGENYGCVNLVLAVPPKALINIIKKNELIKNAFGDYDDVEKWVNNTKYKNVICITYHFKDYVEIIEHNGLTLNTEWGIIVLNLSEHCEKVEGNEYPVLSAMITLSNIISSYNNKTANECNENELIIEVYRQLQIFYINNVDADYYAIINPNNYYDDFSKTWKCKDNAYYNMFEENYIKFKSENIENLYNLGTHNGRSYIQFNCIESAVSNGIALGRELYPDVMKKHYVKRGIYGKDIMILFIILLYFTIFYFSIL